MAERNTPMGAKVDLSPWSTLAARALLFGEAQGRVVVSTADAAAVLKVAKQHGVPARVIGAVTAASAGLTVTVGAGRKELRATMDRLIDAYHEALPRAMSRTAAPISDERAAPALAGGVN